MVHAQADDQHGFEGFGKQGVCGLVPLPEDKRNKQIRFTEAGKQYADSILSELRNAEFAVIEKMGLERIRRLNEDSELFIRLFRELGDGQK